MAVRSFNGTSDILNCATGAASGMTFGTCAAIVKVQDTTHFQGIVNLHDSGGTFVSANLNVTDVEHAAWYAGSESNTGATTLTAGRWWLIVVRKATGTATPRFSLYDYTAATWTHVAGSSSLGDNSAPGASGTIRFNFQDADDWFGSYIAARAVWSNTLPWTADASGDTAIQSSGLKDAASNWLSNNPSAFWLFNQASTATPVDDLSTTGTADQVSITGTTVITGDDPPAFDFTLAGAATPAVQLQYWPSLRGGSWPLRQQALGDLPVVAATNAPADVATATGTAPFDAAGGSISLNLISDNPVTAVGTAYDATVSTANATNAPAGVASATGTANNPQPAVAPSPSTASATGAAQAPSPSVKASAGVATATGTANGTTSLVSTGPSTATATGVANDATVSTTGGTNAAAAAATGTGAAHAPSPAVSPGSGVSTATGSANDTTSKVSPTPTAAAATGTAYNPTVQTGSFTNASAGVATAAGVAQAPNPKVSPSVGVSSATGTANDASAGSSVNATPSAATGTGTANNASVTRAVYAQAGVATATGSVSAVSLGVRAAAEAAAALAAALAPTAGAFLPGTAHAATGTAPTASGGAMTVPTATGG